MSDDLKVEFDGLEAAVTRLAESRTRIEKALAADPATEAGFRLPALGGGKTSFFCCAHFAVTRAALRAHPRRFYEILLDHVRRGEYWEGAWLNTRGKIAAGTMEMLWHTIFGEERDMHRRAVCRGSGATKSIPSGAFLPKCDMWLCKTPVALRKEGDHDGWQSQMR